MRSLSPEITAITLSLWVMAVFVCPVDVMAFVDAVNYPRIGIHSFMSGRRKGFEVAIYRGSRPTDGFVQIKNSAMEDGRLSFKARGLLAYLLSRPEGWSTSIDRLVHGAERDGRESIRTGLKELEELGYLVRRKYRDKSGLWAHDQWVYDDPKYALDSEVERETAIAERSAPSSENQTMGSPSSDFPTTGNPTTGNRTLLTRRSKQEGVNKKESPRERAKSRQRARPSPIAPRSSFGETTDRLSDW